jgi:hypothetical protein
VPEDERGKDEGVLDPLVWSEACEERQEHFRRLVRRGCGVNSRLDAGFRLTGAAGVR